MKHLFFALAGAGLLMSAPATARQPDTDLYRPGIVLTNAASRDGIDLTDAEWGWSIDPYRDGLAGFHGGQPGEGYRRYDPRDVDAWTRENPLALYEYDMRRGGKVMLPMAWDAQEPELRHYEGLMWYERGFDYDPEDGTRAFLRVGAANYSARVYVNGELAGTHEGGFTPFAFDVTELLQDGENRVAIGVDSVRTEDSVPPPVTDWETYGGITRPVKLVVVPETFINDAWIRLGKDGMIAATVALEGDNAASAPVTVEVPALDLTLSGETDLDGIFHGSIEAPAGMERWSPDSPVLYDVTISAGGDTLDERIGFRTVETDGEQLLVNGEPVFLRGINIHEEEIGANPGRVMTEDAARELLSIIKNDMNGNFVRLAHYPHSESTTRLADEMGLFVWSEIPVYWRINWESEATLATARKMQAENILRDRNRASVILWSIGNETPQSAERLRFMETLAEDAHRLDPTRLVTAALLSRTDVIDGVVTSTVDDPLSASLDVMAVNIYHGWYGPMAVEDVSEVRWQSDFDKPMIISETGAGAKAGFNDPDLMRKFSVEYQAEVYREILEMADDIDFLVGIAPWILKDFRSPRRQHPIYQEGWNRKGIISETGEKKPAFDVLAEFYRQKAAE